jgi:hypothetical protein
VASTRKKENTTLDELIASSATTPTTELTTKGTVKNGLNKSQNTINEQTEKDETILLRIQIQR